MKEQRLLFLFLCNRQLQLVEILEYILTLAAGINIINSFFLIHLD
jgi:hypothetical protein